MFVMKQYIPIELTGLAAKFQQKARVSSQVLLGPLWGWGEVAFLWEEGRENELITTHPAFW